jgi:hypothetical protein
MNNRDYHVQPGRKAAPVFRVVIGTLTSEELWIRR